ncbi:MAG: GntR family transcriptional regulator [Actinomadura sp.]
MVFETLQEAIINQALAPGERVSEARLAQQLNVSKTPVREALMRLQNIGLVESVDRGLRVVKPAARNIRNAYEVRAGLERAAASYASERASADDTGRIMSIAEESLVVARGGDADRFRKSDREFHEAIAAAARNEILELAIRNSLILTRVLRERDVPDSGESVGCAEEHLRIAEALRSGDGETAARELWDHVHHVKRIVLAGISGGDGAS